jgi:hypothetical protein
LTLPERTSEEQLSRPLGLTVILTVALLASFVGGLLLVLAPWWVSNLRNHLPALGASAIALIALILLCLGLWRHAGWTWWLLVVPAYTVGVLGLLFAWRDPVTVFRLRGTVMALLYLLDVVWYFQFKPSVVNYYAAIGDVQRNEHGRSRRDAA